MTTTAHGAWTVVVVLFATSVPASNAQPRFEDATTTAGMVVDGAGSGIAVRDYDLDGWPDLFVAVTGGRSSLFRNRGDGTFQDVSLAAGIDVQGGYEAAVWSDFDNDGWSDLLVTGHYESSRLFLGSASGSFSDITDSSGIDPEARAVVAAVADYDNDGASDIFLAVDRGPDVLYRGAGDGSFVDVTEASGVAGGDASVAMQASWLDFDHNGTQDLLVVHDGLVRNRLHLNSGSFPLVNEAGPRGFANVGAGNSMGITMADVDGDGWEDVYVSRLGEAGLYRNNGAGRLEAMEDALGAWRNGMSWGTVFGDFDNDADSDLFVVSNSDFDFGRTHTILYENSGAWFYDRSVSASASIRVGVQRPGVSWLDFDLDGALDLVFPDKGGQVRLLRGIPQNAGNWIRIRLEGTTAPRDAIGSRVVTEVAGRRVTGLVLGGDSFASQSEATVHLGLGTENTAEWITVYWAGGDIETFWSLQAGMEHHVVQGTGQAGSVSIELAPEMLQDRALSITVDQTSLVAFPNPFAADTRIRITLPSPQEVRLSVYDLRGRLLEVLADGPKPQGPSTFSFTPNRLPAGIYFVRLETQFGTRVAPLARLSR